MIALLIHHFKPYFLPPFNLQMAKNKRAPFEPPQYCPESFFPRPYGSRSNNPHRNLNETVEMQDSSYRPPDMYQE